MMSGDLDALQMKEKDVLKFLTAGTHPSGTDLDFRMEGCVYREATASINT